MDIRTARNTAKRLAAILGSDVETEHSGNVFTIHVYAPEGKLWADGGVTALRIEARPTSDKDHAAMWQDAIARMNAGLVDEGE